MSEWTKLPGLPDTPRGSPCACCPDIVGTLHPESRIAVGFGVATLQRDGVAEWSEGPGMEWEDCLTVAEAEAKAAADPDHDWRIEMFGPLHGEVYQRHGPGAWVLVEANQGFA